MIGLDTNVIVRYITQDDPKQAAKANKLIETSLSAHNPGYITLVTLVEIVWVLDSCYEQSKDSILNVIHALLTTRQIVVERADSVYIAMKRYGSGKANFSDAVISVVAENDGCDSMVTFDKKAVSVGMVLL